MSLFRVLSNLMLLMIVLGITAIFLFSPLGTTTISRLINNSHTGVELSGAEGSLLTGLKFENIHWNDDKTDVVLKHTTFKPSKLAYFKSQLSASELTTEALIITIKKSNHNGNKRAKIPNIPIPFNGQIDQLKIDKLVIQDTEGNISFQAKDLVAHKLTLHDQTIKTTQLQGLLDIHHQPMEVNLSPFQLQLDQPHHMNGKGKVSYNHPLAGQIQADVSIGGTLTNYTLDTKLIWKEHVTGKNNISLKLKGDYDHILIKSMQLHNEKGDILLKGKVSWLPTLKIDTLIEGENIQAQKFNPQFPNQVNLKTKLHAEYNYNDSSWEIHNQFERIAGQLNQHKITGKGTIELKDHILRANKLQLTSNKNTLKIDGRITEPFQLSWDINAQNIKQLLPDMTGRIKGKGTLKGTTLHPSGTGNLQIRHLKSKDINIQEAQLTIKESQLKNQQLTAVLSAKIKGLSYKNQKIGSATINFKGYLSKDNKPIGKGKIQFKNLKTPEANIAEGTLVLNHTKRLKNKLRVSVSTTLKGLHHKDYKVGSLTADIHGALTGKNNLFSGKAKVQFHNLKNKDINAKQGTIIVNNIRQHANKITGSVKITTKSLNYKDYKVSSISTDVNGVLTGKKNHFTGKAKIQFHNLKNKDINAKHGTIIVNNVQQHPNKTTGSIKITTEGLSYQGYKVGSLNTRVNGALIGKKKHFSGKATIQFHNLTNKDITAQHGTIIVNNAQQRTDKITGSVKATLEGLGYQDYRVGSTVANFNGALLGKQYRPQGRGKVQFHHLVGKDIKVQHGLITITESKLTANKRFIANLQAKLDGIRYQQYQVGSGILKFKGQHFNKQIFGEGSLIVNSVKHPSLNTKHAVIKFNGHAQKFNLTVNAQQLMIAKQNFQNSAIKASGNLRQHQVTIRSQGDESFGLINMTAHGGWRNNQWQGRIKQVNLSKTSTGQWSLSRPVQLTASAKKLSASEICISNPSRGSLCSTINWRVSHGFNAKGKLNHVPLVQFKPWLPSSIKLSGTAVGHFDIKQNAQGDLMGYAKLQLPDNKIIIKSDHDNTKIQYQNGKIDLSFKGRQITSKINLTIRGRGEISSEATIKLGKQLKQHRINGKALFTVSNLRWLQEFFPDITRLKGGIKSVITFQGHLLKPSYQGSIELSGGQLSIPDTNTHLRSINLLIQTNRPNHASIIGSLQTGGGKLGINGKLAIKKLNDWTAKIALNGKNLQFINTQEVTAVVSPNILLKVSPHSASVTGTLHIPSAELRLEDLPETAIYESDDVIFVSDKKKTIIKNEKPLQIIPNVHITLGKKISFKGFGLQSRLEGKLHITQNNRITTTQGSLSIINGQYRAYGQSLVIEHGRLVFNGPIGNPGLNIRAIRSVDNYKVGLNLAGTLQQPKSSVFSDPALSESDAVSYLITGQSLGNNSGDQVQMLVQAVRSLGINSGGSLLNHLGSSIGLDDVNIITFNDYKKSKLQLGKRLGSRLYIRYITGLFDSFHKVAIDYKINKSWSVQAEHSENQGIDFIYEIDKD